jgi:hypothetical protein
MSVQGITRQPLGEVNGNQLVMASPQKSGIKQQASNMSSPAKKNDHKAELFNSPKKSNALPEPLLDENSDR